MQSRYYDPEVGRFISPDDITFIAPETIGGLNLYSYCGNNPVNRLDPTGHFAFALFLSVLGISALLSGIDGGMSADINGQNFWKGFGAGVVGGLVGGTISFFVPGPWGMMLGRVVNTAIYGVANEFFQNGNLEI